jgi:methyl-accepting chemotaxis protein
MNAAWFTNFNFTLGRKLGLIAGTLAVGLVVVVIVGASGMSSMTAAHHDVVNVGEAKQLAALDARGAATDMHFSQTLYALSGGAGRATYVIDRHTFQVALNRLAALSTDAIDKPLVAAIQSALVRFDRGEVTLKAAVDAHRTADVAKIVQGPENTAADALTAAFTAYQKVSAADVAAQTAQFDSTSSSAQLTMILVGLVAILLGSSVAFLLTRKITRTVRQLLDAADGIAGGDVDQRIDVRSKDELGALANAFTRMTDYLKDVAALAAHVADGDLTVRVEPKSPRDALGVAFKTMTDNLRSLIGEVTSTATSVGAASQEMSSTSEETGKATGEIAQAIGDVAVGAERQVQMVETARRAADEVTAAVIRTAEQAEQTAEVATHAREAAQHGVRAAEQANDAMQSVSDSSQALTEAIRELSGKSEQIGAIVATITGIAEQTNLLALNAAIEAARAGDQGRGFAVVADEVRKLAEGSQHAAREISALIGAIQDETGKAVKVVEDGARRTEDGAIVVEQTRAAFLTIGQAVDDMTVRIEEIAANAQEVTASAETMQQSISEMGAVAEASSASTEQVSASTQETSASTEQIAASAHELASNAAELNRLVGRFQISLDSSGSE